MRFIGKIKTLFSKINEVDENNIITDPLVMRVAILGRDYSGKTSIIHKYTGFTPAADNYFTINKIFNYKNYKMTIKLVERNNENYSKIYRGADAFIVIFDVTDRNGLYDVAAWIREIDRYGYSINEKFPINLIVVGNKVDLKNDIKINRSDVNKLISDKISEITTNNTTTVNRIGDIDYIETSAVTGLNIEYLFKKITKKHIARLTSV
jgi:GTPase SAR1 family protein